MNKKMRKRVVKDSQRKAVVNSVYEHFGIQNPSEEVQEMTDFFVKILMDPYPLNERCRAAICTELNSRWDAMDEIQCELNWSPEITEVRRNELQASYKYTRNCYENLRDLVNCLGYRIELIETNTPRRMRHRLREEGHSGIILRDSH